MSSSYVSGTVQGTKDKMGDRTDKVPALTELTV